MAKLKHKQRKTVYTLKLSQKELTALWNGLSVDREVYDSADQFALATGIDNQLAEYA